MNRIIGVSKNNNDDIMEIYGNSIHLNLWYFIALFQSSFEEIIRFCLKRRRNSRFVEKALFYLISLSFEQSQFHI